MAKYYPKKRRNLKKRFSKYAELIAPYLLPEIKLDMLIYDAEVLSIFTEKFGNSIRDINIDFDTPCVYTLKCFNVTSSLQSFDFRESLERLHNLWKLVGDNFEMLGWFFLDHAGWKACITQLKKHCRKLSSILLQHPFKDSEVEVGEIEDLYCSYGDQLIFADLSELSADEYDRIARKCINLRCSFMSGNIFPMNDLNRLSALHNRLDRLNFGLEESFAEGWTGYL